MATLMFAGRLGSFITPQSRSTDQNTLRLALEEVFLERPLLRSYVFDDQGALRRGLWVFVDGSLLENMAALDCPLTLHASVYLRER
jgi:sulfur-carrier protein